MKQRSPTLEGFRAVFRQPSCVLAEIAWRWSIGFAAASLFLFATVEYLRTLPVSATDLFFLSTRRPALIVKAIQHIFHGSAPRLLWTTLLLAAALALAWVVVAALGRVATVNSLLHYFREDQKLLRSTATSARSHDFQMRSLLGLNCFRVATSFAALVGFVGAAILASSASTKTDPSPGSVMLIFFMLAMFVWLVWALLNWLLSLASIFVISEGSDTFGALSGAVGLCRREIGPLFAAGTWFGIAHLTAFIVATSVIAFPLAFAGVLPAGVVLGGMLLTTLLYFASADFLYTGRLAAYIGILELPDIAPAAPVTLNVTPPPMVLTGFDRDELILSDVPNPPDTTSS